MTGRYRRRTRLREILPFRPPLFRLVAKGRDCGDHEWYRHDATTYHCYHCRASLRRAEGQPPPWEDPLLAPSDVGAKAESAARADVEDAVAAAWFYVHPAAGVVHAGQLGSFKPPVPVDWHPDGEDAQADVEDRFLAALVEFLAEPGTTFTADLPLPEDQQRLHDAARAAGVTVGRTRGSLAGPLDPALAGAFTSGTQLVLSVRREGVERLHLHDDVRRTFVQLTEHEVEDLRSLLNSPGLLL